MTRATYDRKASGNTIVYDIVPVPASETKVFGTGSVTLTLQTVFVFLFGLIPAFVIGSILPYGIVLIPVIAIAIPVYFVRWTRGKWAKMLGTRQTAQVSIQDDAVRISREDGTVTVPADKVRRLLTGNTYDKNRAPESTIIVSNPSTGQLAGQAMRANMDQKLTQVCFSLELQHGNESTLIVDGLDELTTSNLLDDMARDLQMEK